MPSDAMSRSFAYMMGWWGSKGEEPLTRLATNSTCVLPLRNKSRPWEREKKEGGVQQGVSVRTCGFNADDREEDSLPGHETLWLPDALAGCIAWVHTHPHPPAPTHPPPTLRASHTYNSPCALKASPKGLFHAHTHPT